MNIIIIRMVVFFLLLLYITKRKKRDFLTYIVFIIALVIVTIPSDKKYTYTILANPYLIAALVILFYEIGIIIYNKIRNLYYKYDSIKDIDSLAREINIEYNPSIIGYLNNQKLEIKDLSADILNLFARKIINIKKDETDKYTVEKGDCYNKEINNLQESDKYIIEQIIINFSDFDFELWSEKVKKQYKELDFTREINHISDKTFFIIILTTLVLGTIIINIFLNSILLSFTISAILGMAITFFMNAALQSKNNKNIILTKEGKENLKKCFKLKRFMTEYTLLDDRKPEEISIYEEYIPYAVALGINKEYKKTIYGIFDREELKDIIYSIRKNRYEI